MATQHVCIVALALAFGPADCALFGEPSDRDETSELASAPAAAEPKTPAAPAQTKDGAGGDAAPSDPASAGAGDEELPAADQETEALMRAAACDERLEGESGRPTPALMQAWLCDDGAVLNDLWPDEGVFVVRAGENPDGSGVTTTATYHCGDGIYPYVDALRDELMPYVLNHLEAEGKGDAAIVCDFSACTLPGSTEFQPELQIRFEGDGAQLRVASVVAIDTVLVDDKVVDKHRAWAKFALEKRPASCPSDPVPAKPLGAKKPSKAK
jgi:hypothetical protein